ncbi:MAG: 50S ribosomal protein L4 [Armatimonadota bacterium]|nr:50S ribosomal protein L4 [bacterium]
MAKISLRNMAGEQVGDLELKAELFEVEPNIALMHQAVVAEQANMRQGTADTKNRSEVSGGGAKPYRQKGTGRARQGSIRAPHYYHGGVVFGPSPRSYSKALPKKMKRGALRSAWSARLADEDVIVLDEIKLDGISTKKMAAFLKGVGATRKALVVLDGVSQDIWMSSKNIPGVELRIAPSVSVRDILNADKIVMTQAAVAKLEEVFA